MELWMFWWSLVMEFRPAFSRYRTFLWFGVVLSAMCIRMDHRFVTCMPRALGLPPCCYERFLGFFHSSAVQLELLTKLWTNLAMRIAKHKLLRVNGRIVLLADGIKVAKSGRKMPAVKKLHQESQNNSKPEYIYGHSCQAIALVIQAASTFFALPLCSRIHEGLVFSNRDKRTLLDKLVALFLSLDIQQSCYLVADAYYASSKIIRPLIACGHHLIAAVRKNAVAYENPTTSYSGRGRPRKYGAKIQLRDLFNDTTQFIAAPSPVYGETKTDILYRTVDLLWRPVGITVRFVLVSHPSRGKVIFLCSDLTLQPIEIIRLYGIRFKIEVSFKQAIHTIGTYCYHFWMAAMNPIPRRSGDQYLHRKSEPYRRQVRRKFAAYHCHIQVGIIAQGVLQLIAVIHPEAVWKSFASWLRTKRPGIPPSEWVVSIALRNAFPYFLADADPELPLTKFLHENMDPEMAVPLRLIA